MAPNLQDAAAARAAAYRLYEVIDRVPVIDTENHSGRPAASIAGNIEFRSVPFAYPSRASNAVLENFHMKIEAGKTVALVGPTRLRQVDHRSINTATV